jgi:hypothetical protein
MFLEAKELARMRHPLHARLAKNVQETIHAALLGFFEEIPQNELIVLPQEVRGFYSTYTLFRRSVYMSN